jgi:2-succinyl-5-enolpyruvyl-6-hydroxy-3-cyclohexene-1-carboxylate synthase
LLINNGKGTEFRLSSHTAAQFGEEADRFIAAAGHFENKSLQLVKTLCSRPWI